MTPFFSDLYQKRGSRTAYLALCFPGLGKTSFKKGGLTMNTEFWGAYADDSDKAAWLSLEMLQKRQIADAVALYGEEKVKKALKKL